MLLPRRRLYTLAALVWGVPGGVVTIKGFGSYGDVPSPQLWWLLIATLCVAILFYLIFRRVTYIYISRLSALPEECFLYQIFPLKGWLLILFMMSLGIALKLVNGIPIQFIASFYSGLGPMLILAAFRFLFATIRL